MKKKAFTLIELIAVLVILAILFLIVTPLVMNIIRKARISVDKRSIDAYGRSIELAIATYLLGEGKFPTSIDELTIEYSGDRVVCETSQLNSDSSVYLAGCTVAGRDYTYGKEENVKYSAYSIGEEVEYKGINFYVIKNSDATSSTVTLLKAEPLTVSEVNEYGEGHLNNYSYCTGGCQVGIASNQNGYGRMAYYTSPSCGEENYSGCTTNYASSDVKYVVDGWTQVNLTSSDLVVDSTGYSSRLLTIDELENLNYSW